MELAGLACAQTLASVYDVEKYKRVLVCCGPGNQVCMTILGYTIVIALITVNLQGWGWSSSCPSSQCATIVPEDFL